MQLGNAHSLRKTPDSEDSIPSESCMTRASCKRYAFFLISQTNSWLNINRWKNKCKTSDKRSLYKPDIKWSLRPSTCTSLYGKLNCHSYHWRRFCLRGFLAGVISDWFWSYFKQVLGCCGLTSNLANPSALESRLSLNFGAFFDVELSFRSSFCGFGSEVEG